jgi:hypothetical protein
MGTATSGFVKINSDAPFYHTTRSGGRDAICTDSSEICFDVVGSLSIINHDMHAGAIQVAEHLNMGQVIFETDCINL